MAGRTVTIEKDCECGCGQAVRRSTHRFLHGHNTRVNNPMHDPTIRANHRHSPEALEKKRQAWIGKKNPMHQEQSRIKVFTAERAAKIGNAHWRGGSPNYHRQKARQVAALALGRKLYHTPRRTAATELVHHINFDESDNQLQNLAVLTHAMHRRLHGCIKRHRAQGYFRSLSGNQQVALRSWMEENW